MIKPEMVYVMARPKNYSINSDNKVNNRNNNNSVNKSNIRINSKFTLLHNNYLPVIQVVYILGKALQIWTSL